MCAQAPRWQFRRAEENSFREGAKANHLSYLGDATIGPGSNIGAGTITCNYDGIAKYPTTIGSRVFIGSDSALVAPIRIGDGAYIAAGSIITENVSADALAIARGRQVNKPGWAAARRRMLAAAGKKAKKTRKRIAPHRTKTRKQPAKNPAVPRSRTGRNREDIRCRL